MKKLTLIVLVALLALSACKKTSDSVSTNVTADEAVNLMAGTLSTNSNGFITASSDIAVNSQAVYDANTGCGNTKAYTATHQSAAGAIPIYSNTFAYSYTMNCNASNLPDNITGTASDNGSFDGPNLSFTNAGTATFRVTGFTSASHVFSVNAEYKRTGSFASKVGSKSTGNSTVDIVISNLVIDKTTNIIVSGTAIATVNGTTAKGTTINFTGNLTFNNNGTATATLNGTVYIIDLITGAITKK